MKSPEDAMRELGIDRAAIAEAMATMWRFRSDLQTLITLEDIADRLETKEHQIDA